MMCLRSVCFVAAATLVCVAAQMAVRSQNPTKAPAMQKGVSVEMAVANHAQAWPQADDPDAWVVTVDDTGRLYFRADPMTPAELEKWMSQHPRRRDQEIYIKADARAPYADVEKALDAASDAQFVETVLLVNQPNPAAKPGSVVAPKGLNVSVGSDTPSSAIATVVELSDSGRRGPLVKINNDEIPWSALDETVKRHFQKGDDKLVVLRADTRVPFGEIVHAIDDCRAAGAKVALQTDSI